MCFIGFFLFYYWMLLSLFYTSSQGNSIHKIIYFGTNFAAFFPFFVNSFNIRRFIQYCTIGVFGLVIWFVPILLGYEMRIHGIVNEYSKGIIGLYLGLNFILGILVCALITSRELIFNNRAVDCSIAFAGLICMLLLGGRGPLIFLVLCLLLYRLSKPVDFKVNLPKSLAYGSLGLIITFVTGKLCWETVTVLAGRTMYRLSGIYKGFIGGVELLDTSSYERIDFIYRSLELIFRDIKNCLIGTGIGSWNFEIYGVDKRGYPHNIILEIWSELGIIGVLVFSILLIPLIKKRKLNYKYISIFVLIYLLLNVLKSSGLEDLRISFCFAFMFLLSDNELTSAGRKFTMRKSAKARH
ncbi:MAG: hypothetical protein JRI67_07250 [Deltaproteobacteria bacterium]|nr:hypothetical protein [Deltaproteobacteria bacterium]